MSSGKLWVCFKESIEEISSWSNLIDVVLAKFVANFDKPFGYFDMYFLACSLKKEKIFVFASSFDNFKFGIVCSLKVNNWDEVIKVKLRIKMSSLILDIFFFLYFFFWILCNVFFFYLEWFMKLFLFLI
jgi:hypothetical protein